MLSLELSATELRICARQCKWMLAAVDLRDKENVVSGLIHIVVNALTSDKT